MEFAVQMSCASCEDAVRQSLDGLAGHSTFAVIEAFFDEIMLPAFAYRH